MNQFMQYGLAWVAERDKQETALWAVLGDKPAAEAVSRCAQATGAEIASRHPGISSSETQIKLLRECVKRASSGESAESIVVALGAMS